VLDGGLVEHVSAGVHHFFQASPIAPKRVTEVALERIADHVGDLAPAQRPAHGGESSLEVVHDGVPESRFPLLSHPFEAGVAEGSGVADDSLLLVVGHELRVDRLEIADLDLADELAGDPVVGIAGEAVLEGVQRGPHPLVLDIVEALHQARGRGQVFVFEEDPRQIVELLAHSGGQIQLHARGTSLDAHAILELAGELLDVGRFGLLAFCHQLGTDLVIFVPKLLNLLVLPVEDLVDLGMQFGDLLLNPCEHFLAWLGRHRCAENLLPLLGEEIVQVARPAGLDEDLLEMGDPLAGLVEGDPLNRQFAAQDGRLPPRFVEPLAHASEPFQPADVRFLVGLSGLGVFVSGVLGDRLQFAGTGGSVQQVFQARRALASVPSQPPSGFGMERFDKCPGRQLAEASQAALAEEAFTGELGKLVAHLTERLSGQVDGKPKIFRDSAIGNLSEFFDRFRQLNVRSNEQLDALVADAQRIVRGVDP